MVTVEVNCKLALVNSSLLRTQASLGREGRWDLSVDSPTSGDTYCPLLEFNSFQLLLTYLNIALDHEEVTK